MKTFVLKGYEMCYGHGNAGEWRFVCAVLAPNIEAAAKKLGGKIDGSGSKLYFNSGRRTPSIVANAIVRLEGKRGQKRRESLHEANRRLSIMRQYNLEPAPVVR